MSAATIVNILRTTRARGLRDTGADLVSYAARPAAAYSHPRHLQIEIITRCNLGCVMCPRTVALERAASPQQKDAWQREMPFDKYLAVINQFTNLQTLSLHGIGEPLMHSHIFEMVEAAAARGVQVRFTTNATLLNQAKCERLIQAGLNGIIISLDGATAATYNAIRVRASFDQVIENIRSLSAARREMGASNPMININMVVSSQNHFEAPRIVDMAHSLGADAVILSPLLPPETEMASLVCDWETWNKMAEEAKVRAQELGISLHLRGGIRRQAAGKQAGEKKTYQCLQPWSSCVVMLDGEVMPCCNIHDPAYSLGNVFTNDFSEIWNGPGYRSFRVELRTKGHVPKPCRWCPEF